ncbi:hypothetical protein CA13_44770 [Planctomycetes bacterium CA13]|uniref:Uncharacterized protein n=1 Tax=Novipirellula herctigrandis TaxID=2527986 RepID=A0A5C5Z6V2_9BACT|nr:hypothetical protein CA13_44770 [Planctomycetes bacterium CA13]
MVSVDARAEPSRERPDESILQVSTKCRTKMKRSFFSGGSVTVRELSVVDLSELDLRNECFSIDQLDVIADLLATNQA